MFKPSITQGASTFIQTSTGLLNRRFLWIHLESSFEFEDLKLINLSFSPGFFEKLGIPKSPS